MGAREEIFLQAVMSIQVSWWEKIALEVTYDQFVDNIIQKFDSFTGGSVTACGVLMQPCTTGCWDDIDGFFPKGNDSTFVDTCREG